jgi:plasmid maintenance system antidote protein VapI
MTSIFHAQMALRPEGAPGTSAGMWLNKQTSHDLWLRSNARRDPAACYGYQTCT